MLWQATIVPGQAPVFYLSVGSEIGAKVVRCSSDTADIVFNTDFVERMGFAAISSGRCDRLLIASHRSLCHASQFLDGSQ